jgi:ribosome biogenesis GTPase / thiamine phosphate phosphatase
MLMSLEDLGFSAWFLEGLVDSPPGEEHAARVVAVDRDRYLIRGTHGQVPAELTGKLLYGAETTEDIPCVGDWVLVDYYDGGTLGIVHDLLPRRTILRRRKSGPRIDYQSIAANVDVSFIVQAADTDYSLNRLDRYIAMARDGGIVSILLLTKTDLIDEPTLESMVTAVGREHSIDVIPLSSATGAGCELLDSALEKGKTYCLIGSSGVGKSTILNRLVGKEEFATNCVREKSGKGRHTTTRRQLVMLDNGALFIDTPGMRELGMLGFDAGLGETFEDIALLAANCRFPDCTHTVETGCSVLAGVSEGRLTAERYQSYLKLMRESKRYEMTYLERRRKDKSFGKMIKSYMKHHQRR